MTQSSHYPLLDKIDLPADLRALPESALPQVAAEVRAFLLDSVSQSGGHFAAGLGHRRTDDRAASRLPDAR
jgi:1-deoxy-D-xylulose-5-phosphate synthase